MKKHNLTLLALLITALFTAQANAAKANYERTKPHVNTKINDVDSDCDGIPAQSLQKSSVCKGKKTAKKAKKKIGAGHITVLKSHQKPVAGGIKAQDHNATRSNKTSAKKIEKPNDTTCDHRDLNCDG